MLPLLGLALCLFAGAPLPGGSDAAAIGDRPDRLVQLDLALPDDYEPADFGVVLRPGAERDGGASDGIRLPLLLIADRLLVRVPLDAAERCAAFTLDVVSHDGLFRATTALPRSNGIEVPSLPMEFHGGSALSVRVEELPALRGLRGAAGLRQPVRLVLFPPDPRRSPIETRVDLGRVRRLEALDPGLYRYRAWSNVSEVREGEIVLEPLRSCSLALALAPAESSGQIRVVLRADGPAAAEPTLFLLLESVSGPRREFTAWPASVSVAAADARITWRTDGDRLVGEAVFEHVPVGEYRIGTAPGFGVVPESAPAEVGGLVELAFAP